MLNMKLYIQEYLYLIALKIYKALNSNEIDVLQTADSHMTIWCLIKEKDLSISNDMKILATAIDYNNHVKIDEVIFVTNDLALKAIANLFFGDGMIESVNEDNDDDYKGYLDYSLTNSEME